MAKTVLILGNGFDLAHGLPTKYSDFLNFCNIIYEINVSIQSIYSYKLESDKIFPMKNYNKILNDVRDKCIVFSDILRNYLNMLLSENNFYIMRRHGKIPDGYKEIGDRIDKIYYLLKNNIWYNYFKVIFKNEKINGENWIDFESEISFIIQILDRHTENITNMYNKMLAQMDNYIRFESKFNDFHHALHRYNLDIELKSVKEIRKIIYNDLENLILALEIYLSFVKTIPIHLKSLDISESYNYIINFNYTHTYQMVYSEWANLFNIHGAINEEPNNMVLGIDEYWSEGERNNHTNFTIFKKFAQRIQKRTGIESYKWFDQIKYLYKENNTNITKVYIFGHSLDVTDKDILCDYLNDDATDVTIFCRDKETEGEYIANVIKIIGEKRLLEKVNQNPPKLKFVIQQDMLPIEKKDLSASEVVT